MRNKAKKTKKLCFISYAHQGMNSDLFDYLTEILRDGLGTHVKVLIDKDLEYGKDFSSFMELVSSVSTIIILLTPEYKHKITDRAGGVYEEFVQFYNRFQESSDKQKGHVESFSILPILLSGNKDSSVPEELENIKYLDLRKLHVRRRPSGEFIISRKDKAIYLPQIRKIISQILASAAIGTEEYRSLSETFYDDLFVDLKASWDRSVEGRNLITTQFVKTTSYYKIKSQEAYFAIGRKGSGKSTLVQVFPLLQHDHYHAVIKITADHFNLEALYLHYSDPQFRSDTSTVIPRQKAFEYVWEASLMMALMEEIVGAKTKLPRIYSLPATIPAIKEFIKKAKGERKSKHVSNDWSAVDYFNFCFASMVRYVRDCIDNARNDPEFFYSDIGVRFKLEEYLNYTFGEEICEGFWALLRSLNRKFLVTLDGFDTAFDEFRLQSIRGHDENVMERRTFFEIDWLRSLLGFVIKAKTTSDNYFYSALDFCVVAPMDRFMEVVRVERDSYRNWNRWFTLEWSGLELAILLRKRLEGLAEIVTTKEESPESRLLNVLKSKQFSHIPTDLEFEFNRKSYHLPLFMYVLRHTFWRPREVLLYYSRIMAMAENLKRWNTPITSESIRRSVKSTTKLIIEEEFIDELKSTVVNISQITNSFVRQNSQLDFQALRKIVSTQDYKFATGDFTERDIVAKIRFLYSIGFLGLHLTDEQQTKLGHWHNDVFYFNEGLSIFDNQFLDETDLNNYVFVIHPVFSEYLRLNTANFDLPLCFDWEYLNRAEAALIARQ